MQAVNNLCMLDSVEELATGVLTQISTILNFGTEGVLCAMLPAPEAIPLSARIVALADVFDALLYSHPCKKPWLLPEVLTYLNERNGTQFDPDVIRALMSFLEAKKPQWSIAEGH